MELCIDTSTAIAGVALTHEGRLLHEMTWRAGREHTVQLMPAIEGMLRRASVTPQELDAIIVAVGPGSFSGLRVGMSAAKGFGLALGVPLAGVSTLAVEAYPHGAVGLPVHPVLDAGRGEIAVGSYRFSRDLPEETEPPRITTVEALCAEVCEPTLFCGEHLDAVGREIAGLLGPLAVIPPASALARRPSNLAALGWAMLQRGEIQDPAVLQPLYLRAPSITKPKQPRAARR